MDNICKNCGNSIAVAIFKNSGFCSDDCRKAGGGDRSANGSLILLTPDEQSIMTGIREGSLLVRHPHQKRSS